MLNEYSNNSKIVTNIMEIMMTHRLDSFIFGNASEVMDIHLVVSGHTHGRQVVLLF